MDHLEKRVEIAALFNSYFFFKTPQGGIAGRPINPFPVNDDLYYEFEGFATTATYYVTVGIEPGIYHRGHIETLELTFEDREDWGFENSDVPVEREYIDDSIFQMKFYNLIDKSKWGNRQIYYIKDPN